MGRVITAAPGAVELWASLSWQSAAEARSESLLPALSDVVPDAVKPLLSESPGTDGATRYISGEIRAFDVRTMVEAVDGVLRTLVSEAAVSEAVLETRVFRIASPWTASGHLCGQAGRWLRAAGYRVTFGRSWAPVSDVDVAVGGSGAEFHEVFRERVVGKTRPAVRRA